MWPLTLRVLKKIDKWSVIGVSAFRSDEARASGDSHIARRSTVSFMRRQRQ
jgi:hypothetical protein